MRQHTIIRATRRAVLAGIASTLAPAPLVSHAQQIDRVRLIGALVRLAADDAGFVKNFGAFVAGLRDAGWVEGKNIRFEIRHVPGGNVADNYRAAAKQLVALTPDAIVAVTPGAAAALHETTTTIPILFVIVDDPVGRGLVASIARPGGNVTGIDDVDPNIGGKRIQLLNGDLDGIGHDLL